jgi:hypothetical protein
VVVGELQEQIQSYTASSRKSYGMQIFHGKSDIQVRSALLLPMGLLHQPQRLLHRCRKNLLRQISKKIPSVRDVKIGSMVCAVSPFQMTHARRMVLNGYSAHTLWYHIMCCANQRMPRKKFSCVISVVTPRRSLITNCIYPRTPTLTEICEKLPDFCWKLIQNTTNVLRN